MDKCNYYNRNNYCKLYEQHVASAYCGDICRQEIYDKMIKAGENFKKELELSDEDIYNVLKDR